MAIPTAIPHAPTPWCCPYGRNASLSNGFFLASPTPASFTHRFPLTMHQACKVLETAHSCTWTLQAHSITKDGIPMRFCQQCGRFHHLNEFDGEKRSCRARLQKHNARRRKKADDPLEPGFKMPRLDALAGLNMPPQVNSVCVLGGHALRAGGKAVMMCACAEQWWSRQGLEAGPE
eukprot:353725-Chlamydomonas_euryale.AAC.3